METMLVYERETVTDDYGDEVNEPTVPAEAEPVLTFDNALIAPRFEGEEVGVSRVMIPAGFDIYLRLAAPSGIDPQRHVVEFRGSRYEVDGLVSEWRSKGGIYQGDHFRVFANTN